MVLLHGHLQIKLFEAHDIGRAFYSKKSVFKSIFKGLAQNAKQTIEKHKHADRDCYIAVYADFTKLFETRIIPRTGDPVWNEAHTVAVAHDVRSLRFLIKDSDRLSAEHVAEVRVDAAALLHDVVEGWFPLRNIKGKTMRGGGEIKLRVRLIGIPDNPVYARGINAQDPNSAAVEDAFFPERGGNQVIMYQDAHCGADLEHTILPSIHLADGHMRNSSHTNALLDMWHAMENAQHIIYITNWHFNPETKNPFDESLPTIGELLKKKSKQGVQVNIMIWDEIDSGHNILTYTKVSKYLHGGGATTYFEGTKVSVKLMPRKSSAPQGIEKILQERFGFAHHQKTMLVDQDVHGQRYLTAYMGGLDFIYLCYDTCAHTPGGRRYEEGTMPWHDCHCCVIGPAAWDTLEAYEQQWLTLAEEYHDHLKDMTSIPGLAGPRQAARTDVNGDSDTWRVQIFRCMDSGSSNFKIGEEDPAGVLGRGLGRAKGVLIDAGLHSMYVHAIRRAKHFIYIENQFFTGSSFAWDKYQDSGADNLVPIEIALRIVHAIDHDERFTAYLVIPLHPERPGPQRSAILLYTWHTIAMMYRVIGEALQRKGSDAHPQDYLNFYALANRHKEADPELDYNKKSEKGGAHQSKSFIHVHAKTMVQDDEYVSISSANLNQRSLDGTRDTELGMGSWQPAYTLATARRDKQVGHGPGQKPGDRDSVDAGPAEGFMDERGGNYADINMERGRQAVPQPYTVNEQPEASSRGRSASEGRSGHQNSGGVVPGNTAGATHAGGVHRNDSTRDVEGVTSIGQPDTTFHQTTSGSTPAAVSQGADPVPTATLVPQPPSASWGEATAGQPTPDVANSAKDPRQQQGVQHTPSLETDQFQQRQGSQSGQQRFEHAEHAVHGQRGATDQAQPIRGGIGPGQEVAYPKGEVYGYRMALWLEHLGGKFNPLYDQPHSLECVKHINSLAKHNWLQFDGDEDVDMTGHLVAFPINVDRNGDVKPIADGQFSDIDNTVVGKSRPIPAMFLN
ncbi:hypothetical protein ABBQ32_013195 [Trebouxia sp. C0010 RCD-2024]